jgi:hypothetical protein
MSSFRRRLVVFGYPLLELITIYLVAQWIGWGWTFLLILLGIPVGFALMRNAGDAAVQDVVKASQSGAQVDASRHTLPFVGGLLIAILERPARAAARPPADPALVPCPQPHMVLRALHHCSRPGRPQPRW